MMVPVRKLLPLGALAFGVVACGDDDPVEPEPQPGVAVLEGALTQSRTLYADTTYTLRGFVRIPSGVTLTVQPGTRIVGDVQDRRSSLFVLRGGRLVAEGTATQPIVFTSGDDVGSRQPGDWGGIVMIGNAPISRPGPLNTEGPNDIQFDYSGGTNVDDNSGSLRYVRIEFAGFAPVTGNELNALSLYAVGRGTTLQYVQTHGGLDDHFEWFGGTVDGQYLVSSEALDDHFDWTQGYVGRNQFVLGVQTRALTPQAGSGEAASDPRGFEGDGCEAECPSGFDQSPRTLPVFANFTMAGPGTGVLPTGGGVGLYLRRGTGGVFVNGIVANWPGNAVAVRDAQTSARFAADSLVISNIVFAGNAANYEAAGGSGFFTEATFAGFGMQSAELATLLPSYPATGGLANGANFSQLIPAAGTVAATAGLDSFATLPFVTARITGYKYGTLTGTSYVGAIQPGTAPAQAWWAGWTAYPVN